MTIANNTEYIVFIFIFYKGCPRTSGTPIIISKKSQDRVTNDKIDYQ